MENFHFLENQYNKTKELVKKKNETRTIAFRQQLFTIKNRYKIGKELAISGFLIIQLVIVEGIICP